MQNRTPSARPVLDFEPVPRKYRCDGWTADRQRGFIAALAETGSVKHAAQRINMSPEGAYYLRRQPGAESFCAAWSAALDHGVQRFTDIAIDRAIEGVPVPIHWQGQQIGEKRLYDNRLLQFVLRHHLPDRYGMPGLRPGTKSQDTLEREAVENCAVCRARAQACDAPEGNAEEVAALEAYIDEVCKHYAAKVRYERRQWLAGDVVAADFTVRQLTMIEQMLAAGGAARYCAAVWAEAEECCADDESEVSEFSDVLADVRHSVWEEEARLRPTMPRKAGSTAFWAPGSDTAAARSAAQREARDRIAAAQAQWEAAATEQGWAERVARAERRK